MWGMGFLCLYSIISRQNLTTDPLVPILLGQGTRLFDQLGTKQIELERMGVIESESVTHLRFRVIK